MTSYVRTNLCSLQNTQKLDKSSKQLETTSQEISMILLQRTLYIVRRKSGRLRFYNNSRTKIGYQSIKNRLADVFLSLNFDHYCWTSDHNLLIFSKKCLDFIKTDPLLQNDRQRDFTATQTATQQPHVCLLQLWQLS